MSSRFAEEYRRLSGLVDDRRVSEDAPWDLVDEALGPKDFASAKELLHKQGYADLSKGAKFKLDVQQAIGMALSLLVNDPKKKTTYIKDPAGLVVSAEALERAVEKRLTGDGTPSYGAFGFDNNDHEIYADGPDVFADGRWGYEVTQAADSGQNDALDKHPPKVKATRIKGKTAEGWRIDINPPYEFYLAAGKAAAEKKAAELAKQGVYPPEHQDFGHRGYPKELAARYAAKAPRKSTGCEECEGEQDCKVCGFRMEY